MISGSYLGCLQDRVRSTAAVRVSAHLARAHARLGAYDQFTDTLRATQTRLSQLDACGSDLFSADAGRLASYAASSYIWLGQPQQAVPYAKDAILFYGEVSPEERSPTREAISRLDLALAFVDLDSPDDAARVRVPRQIVWVAESGGIMRCGIGDGG